MDEYQRFHLGVLIACLAGLLIVIPATMFMRRKYLKEGKSIKYLPLKMCTEIGIPIMYIVTNFI